MPTEPVLPESELQARAIERLSDGRLPLLLSTEIEAGYGTGVKCVLCDQPSTALKVEYEGTDPGSGIHLHFHIACHFAWQRVCVIRILRGGADQTPL